MNKAITDGLDLMPPAFREGLDKWSNQDGTPGSTTYDTVATAALVPGDADFGTCLELQKTDAVQKIRHVGQTPILPGCYLKVSARVKAISGNLPTVQVAGWAGDAAGNHVPGLVEVGPAVPLTAYGEVVEVWAIIGTGNRQGVDMVWGTTPVYGHLGLDLTGPDGGVVRIEDIRIEDATSVFYRKLMDWVDVRDFGAVGDGVTDDSAAFEAADAAAGGRRVLVSEGTYYLGQNVTFESTVRFEGTVTMPDGAILSLTRNFDLPSYVDAFGDEELGFRKAIQALFNFTDHESLDMKGLRVTLTRPLDVHAAVGNKDTYANRRVLRNGQLQADGGTAWQTEQYSSQATYDPAQPTTLSAVANIAQIPVGALVEGVGVGREVYVRSKNVAAGTIELSRPLYAAPAQQTYSFTRFKYLLDFSGFTKLQRFNIDDVEFLCQGNCSALMLPPDGLAFQVRDCFITAPLDRGITSIGRGCSGLQLDRNQFLSNEQALDVAQRRTVAFNVNANDTKIRENRAVRFKHFGVVSGTGHLIQGNHFFQGDNALTDQRTAGLILTSNNPMTLVEGNYVDNCVLEWTNEHDATPDNAAGFSFGGLTIVGNIFYASNVPSWFRAIRIKPHGSGHTINGLNINGNTFRIAGGTIQRVEEVDDSIAPLDTTSYRNVIVEGNTFNNITDRMMNPAVVPMESLSPAATWTADFSRYLPFGGRVRYVASVTPHKDLRNSANAKVWAMPYPVPNSGVNGTEVKLNWPEPVSGKVYVTLRVDNPT